MDRVAEGAGAGGGGRRGTTWTERIQEGPEEQSDAQGDQGTAGLGGPTARGGPGPGWRRQQVDGEADARAVEAVHDMHEMVPATGIAVSLKGGRGDNRQPTSCQADHRSG